MLRRAVAVGGVALTAFTGLTALAPPAGADIAVLRSTMSGANEFPGPGDPNASGSTLFTADSRRGRLCYIIRVEGLQPPATLAHIHVGDAGTAGPVVVPLVAPNAQGISVGCTNADPALVQAIIDNPSHYYTNVHNSVFPKGAVRGQLSTTVRVPTPSTSTTFTTMGAHG